MRTPITPAYDWYENVLSDETPKREKKPLKKRWKFGLKTLLLGPVLIAGAALAEWHTTPTYNRYSEIQDNGAGDTYIVTVKYKNLLGFTREVEFEDDRQGTIPDGQVDYINKDDLSWMGIPIYKKDWRHRRTRDEGRLFRRLDAVLAEIQGVPSEKEKMEKILHEFENAVDGISKSISNLKNQTGNLQNTSEKHNDVLENDYQGEEK